MADEKQSAGTASAGPPDYDTLSIAPPTIDHAYVPTSRPGNGQDLCEANAMVRDRKKSLKERWQELKEEDEKRKAAQLQHVTHEEADRITGLDKHKERETKKSAEGPRGGKSLLGAFGLF